MRTIQEIKERIKKQMDDPLNIFSIHADLVVYLPWEDVQEYLKEGTKKSEWEPRAYTREKVIGEMVEYLPFAFDEAWRQHGLSADRSIQHMCQWLWLLEDELLYNFARNPDNYPQYGLPILERIKKTYAPELVIVKPQQRARS